MNDSGGNLGGQTGNLDYYVKGSNGNSHFVRGRVNDRNKFNSKSLV